MTNVALKKNNFCRPFLPGAPGIPAIVPGPGKPGRPLVPGNPGVPGLPGVPFIPAGPGKPGSPLSPFRPGKPASNVRRDSEKNKTLTTIWHSYRHMEKWLLLANYLEKHAVFGCLPDFKITQIQPQMNNNTFHATPFHYLFDRKLNDTIM